MEEQSIVVESKVTKESLSVAQFIDRNFRYVQYAAYGVGCIGIVLITRSIRLTKKFESVHDIPSEFFEKRVKLYGKVNTITVDEKHLLVLGLNHTPIVSLKGKSQAETKTNNGNSSEMASTENNRLLKITVPGIAIKQQFVPHIKEKVLNQNAKITLVSKLGSSDQAHAFVQYKSRKILPFYTDVGKWCIQNGMGTTNTLDAFKVQLGTSISSHLSSNDKKYFDDLEATLNRARGRRQGLWKEVQKRNVQKWNFVLWFKIIQEYISKFRNK